MHDLICLSGGMNSLLLNDSEREYAYGVGIKSPSFIKQKFIVHYCFELLKHLGNVHQISLEILY